MRVEGALLGRLFAVAMGGAVVTGALHLASLAGFTVTSMALLVVLFAAMFLTFGGGILAHYWMGNAQMGVDGDGAEVWMSGRQLARGLSRGEIAVFFAAIVYAMLASFVMTLSGSHEIELGRGPLRASDARAMWPALACFFVSAAAILLSAKRIARRRQG